LPVTRRGYSIWLERCQWLKVQPVFFSIVFGWSSRFQATLNDALQCVVEPIADVKTQERSGQPVGLNKTADRDSRLPLRRFTQKVG